MREMFGLCFLIFLRVTLAAFVGIGDAVGATRAMVGIYFNRVAGRYDRRFADKEKDDVEVVFDGSGDDSGAWKVN